MTSFTVNVPFSGEALSVYKSLSDIFSSSVFSPENLTRQFDDSATFSYSVSLGVFRVLLDGECAIADQDFDNRISLMKISAKDRGGKGRIDAVVRLEVGTQVAQAVTCECDVTPKGMLARVPIDFSDIFADKIQNVIAQSLRDSDTVVVIDDFESTESMALIETNAEVVDLVDPQTLSALFESGNLRASDNTMLVWVLILRFPATVLSWPVRAIRSIFAAG